jgi:hypothetical protein
MNTNKIQLITNSIQETQKENFFIQRDISEQLKIPLTVSNNKILYSEDLEIGTNDNHFYSLRFYLGRVHENFKYSIDTQLFFTQEPSSAWYLNKSFTVTDKTKTPNTWFNVFFTTTNSIDDNPLLIKIVIFQNNNLLSIDNRKAFLITTVIDEIVGGG